MSIFTLPDELILDILRNAAGDNPLANLRGALGTCRFFRTGSIGAAFEEIEMIPDPGDSPLERHLVFFEESPELAGQVRRARFKGRTSDFQGQPEACCILDADEVLRTCRALYAMNTLEFVKCFWMPAVGAGPQPSFRNLTTLNLLESVVLGPSPFPANITRNLPSLERTTISFVTATLLENHIAGALRDEKVATQELSFPPSTPFPATFIKAAIWAAGDTLERLTVAVTPIAFPPFFLDFPEDISVRDARNLKSLRVIIPTFTIPLQASSNCTWIYARSLLNTARRNTPNVDIIFDCGHITAESTYSRLARFPAQQIEQLRRKLGPASRLSISLRAPNGAERLQWKEVCRRSRAWEDLAKKDNVSIGEISAGQDAATFEAPPQEVIDEVKGEDLPWWAVLEVV